MLSPVKYFSSWVSSTLVIMLSLCVLQTYRYEITIDKVRIIDFDIVKAALTSVSYLNEEYEKLELSLLSEFYYARVLTHDSCKPQKSFYDGMCELLKNKSAFYDLLKTNTVHTESEKKTVSVGKYYYTFDVLTNSNDILVVNAGQYASLKTLPARVEYFLSRLTYYLTTKKGFKKMSLRAEGIWLFTILLTTLVFLTIYLKDLRSYRRFIKAKRKVSTTQEALNISRQELTMMLAEKESLETDYIDHIEKTEEEFVKHSEKTSTKISSLLREIEKRETEALALVEEYEKEIQTLQTVSSKLPEESLKKEFEDSQNSLQAIQNLWLKDISWTERYHIERDFIDSPIGRTPFTIYVAFSSFERLIKNLMIRYGLELFEKNLKHSIEELGTGQFISQKEAVLYQEVRMARNKWIHECVPPNERLFSQLLEKLQRSPRTFPIF